MSMVKGYRFSRDDAEWDAMWLRQGKDAEIEWTPMSRKGRIVRAGVEIGKVTRMSYGLRVRDKTGRKIGIADTEAAAIAAAKMRDDLRIANAVLED